MTARFTRLAIFLAVTPLLPTCSQQAAHDASGGPAHESRPNVVIIFADDLGYGDVSSFSPESKIETPNIDRLARSGMMFTDAHTSSSVCTPSRYGLLTGRYAWRSAMKSGVIGGLSPPVIESGRETIASILGEQGYRTACIGKWHLGMRWAMKGGESTPYRATPQSVDFTQPLVKTPNNFGFDYFFGIAGSIDWPPYCFIENDRVSDPPTEESNLVGRPGPMAKGWRREDVSPMLAEKALAFIASNRDRPFFLYLPLALPHSPAVPNQEFIGTSGIDAYGDSVLEVDHRVGQIMAALEEHDLVDDTLLIFTSDNGPDVYMYPRRERYGHDSSSYFLGAKGDNWEGGHRVPFVARWPGRIEEGSRCDVPFGLVDLLATVAEIVGVALPDNVGEDSVSILPLFEGHSDGYPADRVLIHHSRHANYAVRQGNWKLLLHPGSGGNDYEEPSWSDTPEGRSFANGDRQLYDLASDPAEATNLAREHPEIVRRLTALAADTLERGRSRPGAPTRFVRSDWPDLEWLPPDDE